jgi:hypothetical protein
MKSWCKPSRVEERNADSLLAPEKGIGRKSAHLSSFVISLEV